MVQELREGVEEALWSGAMGNGVSFTRGARIRQEGHLRGSCGKGSCSRRPMESAVEKKNQK